MLAENDAMPMDWISVVRYVRMDEDTGESYTSWAISTSEGMSPITAVGLVELANQWALQGLREDMGIDHTGG